MADDKHRDSLSLRQLHQRHGAVLHLSHAAGGGIQLLVVQRLDRVHDENVRLLLGRAFQHVSQPGFRQHEQVFAVHMQPLSPQLQLPGGFLAGYIQHLGKLPQLLADLQHQGGLADARRAAYQHQ